MTKHEAGSYTITYFTYLGARKKKVSKVYTSYGLARSAGDKWNSKHPNESYKISLTVYNSKSSSKWDYN